jgi:hypothetical protein
MRTNKYGDSLPGLSISIALLFSFIQIIPIPIFDKADVRCRHKKDPDSLDIFEYLKNAKHHCCAKQ